MQVLIELRATNDGIIHSSEKAKHDWERFRLLELLTKLEKRGYRINTLYGRFIFDEAKKEAIDCGEAGQIIPVCMGLVDSIFATNGKMAIIFTDKKYIVFTDRYFLAIHFCHMRRVRPISIYDVVNNFDSLIIDENKELLDKLYLDQFEFKYGKNAEAQSCFEGDTTLRTEGYGVPLPIEKNSQK